MPSNGKPDLSTMADYITKGGVSSVVVMVGAGISTAAGIPDFRSPKTGLYHNLSRLKLPYAEAVFDIDYFRKQPEAFYTLAQELYPGKFKPTLFHSFLKVLEEKGILRRVYTQNIDTLEEIAGVEADKVVYAHGSFAENHCIDCHAEMSKEDLREIMEKDDIPRCKKCKGLVKPDIVFFGENLPARFFKLLDNDLSAADLVIVAGTSLQVHPFASLPSQVSCPRILFNLEAVGDFGRRKTDVIRLGACDEGIRDLADQCGWGKRLTELWESKSKKWKSVEEEEEAGAKTQKEVLKAVNQEAKEEKIDGEDKESKEVEKITEQISGIEIADETSSKETSSKSKV
ncbi:putative histone deacetylase-like protein [Myxozyma melibiosi]|uniref:NAD-dependent protein deacetylase n=1 Tax=Myxozyma melibiosi TaxID=54550 RepID=A0ABR1FFG6_9ASCO